MTSVPDAPLPFSALERSVMRLLSVPSAPEIPEGSPGSLQIFRAGDKFYGWLVFEWALKSLTALPALGAMTIIAVRGRADAPPWVALLIVAGLIILWSVYISVVTLTFLALRLSFRLRWYIVTDRSLRIRSGVFAIRELTMTFRNIQEIRVTAGPIMNALGLANVEVHAAGGGGDPRRGGGGHIGRLEGLSNATEIRDLIVERLRQYRDAGLGDASPRDTHHLDASDADAIAAAKVVLAEVRALSTSLPAALPRR